MIRVTNLLVLLIVISFILPSTAIKYASGSAENSNETSNGPADNNAGASSNGPTASNNTGNAYCDSCNNDIYNGGWDLKSMVLSVHNRERAAVSVPPLIWSDKLATDAKAWAEHLLATGEFVHSTCCGAFKDYGENLASSTGSDRSTGPIAQNMQGWISEKNDYHGGPFQPIASNGSPGHYTQMVWKSTTEVGCGTASGALAEGGYRDVLVCRYTPAGNFFGQPAY